MTNREIRSMIRDAVQDALHPATVVIYVYLFVSCPANSHDLSQAKQKINRKIREIIKAEPELISRMRDVLLQTAKGMEAQRSSYGDTWQSDMQDTYRHRSPKSC